MLYPQPTAIVPTLNTYNPRNTHRGQYATVNTGVPELKAFDTVSVDVNYWGNLATLAMSPARVGLDQLAYVQTLNNVAAGTDISQRIGRKVVGKSVLLRYLLSMSPYGDKTGTTTTYTTPEAIMNMVRIALVWDSQPSGVLINNSTINQIFQTMPANSLINPADASNATNKYSTTPVVCPLSPMNLSNRQRFRVLYDREFFLNLSGPSSIFIEHFQPLGDIETIYQDNSGTVNTTSITHGALYFIAIGDRPGLANYSLGINSTPFVTLFARFKYTDP